MEENRLEQRGWSSHPGNAGGAPTSKLHSLMEELRLLYTLKTSTTCTLMSRVTRGGVQHTHTHTRAYSHVHVYKVESDATVKKAVSNVS